MKEQAPITRRNTLLGATTLAAAAVLGSPMALAPVNAQPVGTPGAAPGSAANEPGKLAPLPDRLPSGVEARVGPVELQRGMPTQKGIEQLFDRISSAPPSSTNGPCRQSRCWASKGPASPTARPARRTGLSSTTSCRAPAF